MVENRGDEKARISFRDGGTGIFNPTGVGLWNIRIFLNRFERICTPIFEYSSRTLVVGRVQVLVCTGQIQKYGSSDERWTYGSNSTSSEKVGI